MSHTEASVCRLQLSQCTHRAPPWCLTEVCPDCPQRQEETQAWGLKLWCPLCLIVAPVWCMILPPLIIFTVGRCLCSTAAGSSFVYIIWFMFTTDVSSSSLSMKESLPEYDSPSWFVMFDVSTLSDIFVQWKWSDEGFQKGNDETCCTSLTNSSLCSM